MKLKQLNPFELKSILVKLLNKINSVRDIQNCLSDIEVLDAQEDKSLLAKFLFKELSSVENNSKIPVICFLLQHFVAKDELIKGLWNSLQCKAINADAKITIINLLRELDADWSYRTCEEFVDDAQTLLDESTKQLLKSAIINPEVQIDFMDFMASINVEDKLALIHSLAQDFSEDELANILIPVFEANPESPVGMEALKLLANTKSQLALHSLEYISKHTFGDLQQAIKKNLAILKMSGIRQDKSKEFYKKILEGTKPHKFYITYPDGYGDIAMICTRLTNDNRIRFVSFVVNIEAGIKDCFGFYDISKFEADKIIEKFLKEEYTALIPPEEFVTILFACANITYQDKKELPYEYVCWKNLLIDIEYDDISIEQFVKDNIYPEKISKEDISNIQSFDFMSRWFLNKEYSIEFADFIKSLKYYDNLDDALKNSMNKIFTLDEKTFQLKKLFMCSYIKYCIGDDVTAGKIYAIICSDDIFNSFLETILKRSIYEYFMLIKFDKKQNDYDFTDEQIRFNIEYIEQNWVK